MAMIGQVNFVLFLKNPCVLAVKNGHGIVVVINYNNANLKDIIHQNFPESRATLTSFMHVSLLHKLET